MPEWQTDFQHAGADLWNVMDCTGDGVDDVLFASEYFGRRITLLDGITGELVLQSDYAVGGTAKAEVHDVDGDGVGDVIFRYPYYSTPLLTEAGKIKVVQGGTGAELWSHTGTQTSQNLSDNVEYTDLDGDGNVDLVAHNLGYDTVALQGHSGGLLWASSDPISEIKWVPDRTGDGIEELIVQLNGPTVDLRNGASGASLWPNPGSYGLQAPYKVHAVADLTGDGAGDFLFTNPDHDNTYANAGGIVAINGSNGQLHWFHEGDDHQIEVGTRVEMFDATGDGTDDVVSLSGSDQRLLNGVTGVVYWSRSYQLKSPKSKFQQVADLNADGSSDLLLRTKGPLVALRSQTGNEMWSTDSPDGTSPWRDVILADVEGDGTTEIVAGSPECLASFGVLAVLNGSDGSYRWQAQGVADENRIGGKIALTQSAISGQLEIATRFHGDESNAGIRMYSADSGQEVWRADFVSETTDKVEWQVHDLAGNGSEQIIEIDSNFNTRVHVFDPATRTIRNRVFALLRTLDEFGVGGDIDGDGFRDLVMIDIEGFDPMIRVMTFSSMQDTYSSGLSVVGGSHSVTHGGFTAIGVTAPQRFKNHPYRLMMSGNGAGYTRVVWADVPLADGDLLQQTLAVDSFPAPFHDAIGWLDNQAKAEIIINTLPGDIPAKLAGRTLAIAVLIEAPSHAPWYSSGVEFLTIKP